MQRNYKISLNDYRKILKLQRGSCANRGCGKKLQRDKNTCVDHDHATMKVRGLLCRGCNTTLGIFRDSPEMIRGLLDYAIQHRQLVLL